MATIGEVIGGAKYRVFPGQPDPLLEHEFYSRTFMPLGTVYDEYDTTDEVVTEIIDNDKFDIPALPAIGTPVYVDELYTYDGNVYRVRQSHDVTAYDPDDIPALFTVYRKETVDMEWIVGEQVDVGVVRLYETIAYECRQAHITELGWEPLTTLALWSVVSVTDEWQTGVSYTVDDIVTYNELTYVCIQSHVSQSNWTPDAVPALWQLQE